MKRKLPYIKWESNAPPGTRFIVGLGFCEYERIAEVVNPLHDWLSTKCLRSYGGLAFFSSYDILTDEERRIIKQ